MKSISQKSKYAIRALTALARRDKDAPVLIAEVADGEEIPRKFLEAILLELRNAGILDSKRGKGGGYRLRKKPDQITLGQLIRLFDGPLAPIPCVSQTQFRACDDCHDVATCGMRLVMREVRDAMAKILDNTTLAELIRRSDAAAQQNAAGLMYHI